MERVSEIVERLCADSDRASSGLARVLDDLRKRKAEIDAEKAMQRLGAMDREFLGKIGIGL